MFDNRLETSLGDRRCLADLAASVERDARVAGCRKLVVAAAWADAHSEVDHPEGGPAAERLVRIGPTGCPPVAEFAPQGLVGPFDTSTQSARGWMADALAIRHRLPRLWERVVAAEVRHWKARQIATLTARLSVAAASEVDEHVTPWVEQLPWASFLRALDAAMLQADEAAYRERERLAAANREVWATQSEAGLRTLIARGEAGDVAMMLALHRRVAECLADEGDEDPLRVRMSKAIGVIANPAMLNDLLLRHRGDADPHREPWEQVAAHDADPTDPWADELPSAGWETAEHANYHDPAPGEDRCRDVSPPDQDEQVDWPADPPIDAGDLGWYEQASGWHEQASGWYEQASDFGGPVDLDTGASGEPAAAPEAVVRATWRPLVPAEASAFAPTVALHVHLSDQTLRDGHGAVRTDAGPILLEQLRHYLIQHEANIKVYPVVDPAETAAADSYEIPLRLRRAMSIRNPRSVFPNSPTSRRMDLDHTPAYLVGGPPGQTGMHTLGPLARREHRAKTVGRWRSRQPEPGTYLWRSPEGWVAVTTNQGTLMLGRTSWATRLWASAA